MNINDLTLNINHICSLLAIKHGFPIVPLGGFRIVNNEILFVEGDGSYQIINGLLGWIKK